MSWINIVLYLIILILSIVYILLKNKHSYWKKRNVYYWEPTLFFGNMKSVVQGEKSLSSFVSEAYTVAKAKGEKYFGFYKFWFPSLVPVDLDLIKCILQKDFAYFPNHNNFEELKNDTILGHLFNLQDNEWKEMRAKLTPAFTSGKLKMMFQTMVECTKELSVVLKNQVSEDKPVEIVDILARFTTDIIGTVGFGIEINSLKNPNSEFRTQGQKFFKEQLVYSKLLLITILPTWLVKLLGVSIGDEDLRKFFTNLIQNTIAHREQNNIYRKDFMHLLIQLKNLGKVAEDDETILISNEKSKAKGFTLNQIVPQALVFFLAGFETSSTTMTFALIELAENEDIQDKLREEMIDVLAKHNNQITYEALAEMEYLEKVISETLRKHPPVAVLPRVCTKEYRIPDSDVVIDRDINVDIPVLAIHRDPEYYPDPEKFDPERFNADNKANRNAFAYLPFGEGPRICIGLRLGKLQVKVGLCSIITQYKVSLYDKSIIPVQYGNGLVSTVKGGKVLVNLEAV